MKAFAQRVVLNWVQTLRYVILFRIVNSERFVKVMQAELNMICEESVEEWKAPASHKICRKAVSKRSVVNEFQALLFVNISNVFINKCSEVLRLRDANCLSEHDFERITGLPEYTQFINAAYACGFVCRDLNPKINLELVNSRSQELVSLWTFPEIRCYVHTLVRAERWAGGHSSPICDSILSGALKTVIERISVDNTLYSKL